MDRIYVAGCPVDRVDREEIADKLCAAIDAGDKTQVLGVNASFVVSAHKAPEYLQMLEATPNVVVDGFWVAIASRVLGYQGVTTVGIERLVYELFGRLAETNRTVYLLGSREEIVRKAAENVALRYPGIQVVGARNGYFDESAEEQILTDLNAANPDVVLVGMSSPKKEEWMARHKDRIAAPVTIGVGGLLDVLADVTPPAPVWVKDIGMEWLSRLSKDPRRLLRRYTIDNAHFIWLIGKDLVLRRQGKATPV